MREIEEERCVRGHEEYRESERKKGVGPFTNCDKEKDRAGGKESCEILKEFAVNIGLYEKYIYVYMYMYVYIAESCNKKRKQVTSHGTSGEQYMLTYLLYCAFYSLNYMYM